MPSLKRMCRVRFGCSPHRHSVFPSQTKRRLDRCLRNHGAAPNVATCLTGSPLVFRRRETQSHLDPRHLERHRPRHRRFQLVRPQLRATYPSRNLARPPESRFGHAFCAHNRCASHRWVRRQSKDLILPPFNAALSAAYVPPVAALFQLIVSVVLPEALADESVARAYRAIPLFLYSAYLGGSLVYEYGVGVMRQGEAAEIKKRQEKEQ
jgi:hypothetical protein